MAARGTIESSYDDVERDLRGSGDTRASSIYLVALVDEGHRRDPRPSKSLRRLGVNLAFPLIIGQASYPPPRCWPNDHPLMRRKHFARTF